MIEVRNLTKRYGDFVAIEDVSFDVAKGAVVGLLGPNGAGKTTAMKILTCFMPPTSGTARIGGHDIFEAPMDVKRTVGYLPEHPPVYPEMTVRGQLTFAAQLGEVPRRDRPARVAKAMDRTGITHQADRLVGNLSKGYQQRVGIAQALVADPPVLILDEPTVGLDPSQILEIRALIQELGQDHTVLLSTHILPEVQKTCERVVIINRGRVAAAGPVEQVARDALGGEHVVAELAGAPEPEIRAGLAGLSGVIADGLRAEAIPDATDAETGRRWTIPGGDGAELRREVSRLAAAKGWDLLALRRGRVSLEEVFIRITSRDVVGGPAGDVPAAGRDPAPAPGAREAVDAAGGSSAEPREEPAP